MINQDTRQLLEIFLDALDALNRSTIQAQPEDHLKVPVCNLLNAFESVPNQAVFTRTESSFNTGRPDIGVSVNQLLCGFIELKAPSKTINPQEFKGHDKEQWEKFKHIPNLIYTNGLKWDLYRYGERINEVSIPSRNQKIGSTPINEDLVKDFRNLITGFLAWEPIVPVSPKGLAEMLAPLCRILRDDVQRAITYKIPAIMALERQWHDVLFTNTDLGQFADAYAQTVTYALLLAKVDGLQIVEPKASVQALLGHHSLLSRALEILSDPLAVKEIGIGVELLVRSISAVDPNKLPVSKDSLWLYFYEDFLSVYDTNLRKNRGVYYTPAEVVLAQIRLVSDILINRFAKRRSFADEGITVIDPAAGTGSYPLAILQHTLSEFGYLGEPQIASKLAENMHAFEILVGPYAVAHLRLTQSIAGIPGASLPKDGINVFLTDTLESPDIQPKQSTLHEIPLSLEHNRALNIKKNRKMFICIGNPPYDRQSVELGNVDEKRKGGWVRYGDREASQGDKPILDDFIKPASDAGYGVHLKNLYNDYVYFWRWALWKVFESTSETDQGIVCFITASSYLSGPAYVGMRKYMREVFDELWIIDLEGDQHGSRKTENIFDIMTPVAIALGVRSKGKREQLGAVKYHRLSGSRTEKLLALGEIHGIDDLEWQECYSESMAPFLPKGKGVYYQWPRVTDIFPVQFSGLQFCRTWPIGETKEVLLKRWNKLVTTADTLRSDLFIPTGTKKIEGTYKHHITRKPLTSLLFVDEKEIPDITRYGYRSFDRQWAIIDSRVADWPRPELASIHSEKQVYIVSMLTGVLGMGPGATVSAELPDYHFFRGNSGGKHIIPLWLDPKCRVSNINNSIIDLLSNQFRRGVKAEELFSYCYCLLASNQYTSVFHEELNEPGPRLPISLDHELFNKAVALGRKLINLQTYCASFREYGNDQIPKGKARIKISVPFVQQDYPDDFKYDSANSELLLYSKRGQNKEQICGCISNVTNEVWNYAVSGRLIVYSWLASRMKAGSGKKVSELDKVRPTIWDINFNEELLELLWMIEMTLETQVLQNDIIDKVIASELVMESSIEKPSSEERRINKNITKNSAEKNNLFTIG